MLKFNLECRSLSFSMSKSFYGFLSCSVSTCSPVSLPVKFVLMIKSCNILNCMHMMHGIFFLALAENMLNEIENFYLELRYQLVDQQKLNLVCFCHCYPPPQPQKSQTISSFTCSVVNLFLF